MTTGALVLLGMAVAAVMAAAAYLVGRRRRVSRSDSKRLDEYPFYPFVVTETGHVEFDEARFREAVDFLLRHDNPRAARELVIIGEQNLVRSTFASQPLDRYRRLFDRYQGDSILSDNDAYLENYKRIVKLIGRSFPRIGFEILLHNLVNPSRSIVAIESGEVTGRTLEMGTTKLVLDLKTRSLRHQDKLNYELNIGSRSFKCTTIPIFREEHGLVGAICLNIDSRFVREAVMPDPDKLAAFFENYLRTDMELDENILSPDEFTAAMNGKRHFLDEAILPSKAPQERILAAIAFSDIVGWTALTERDEAAAFAIRAANSEIHKTHLTATHGRLLKDLGDGLLMSFPSVSDAVECALRVQRDVADDGRYAVRFGIHLGEVMLSRDDAMGDGVNLASRIQAEAEPGTIAVSEVVYRNIRNKTDIRISPLGARNLKNVSEPMVLYSVEAG